MAETPYTETLGGITKKLQVLTLVSFVLSSTTAAFYGLCIGCTQVLRINANHV